ncbi:MAG: hypothetical protein H6701_02160 [Myxococcales bacterium]|nr:hypothetical protein [Myxococcales bacterium]
MPPGLAAEHAARIGAAVRAGERRAVAVSGPAGAGRQALARALAGALDRPLYVLDGAALVEADEAGFAAAVAAARVAALLDDARSACGGSTRSTPSGIRRVTRRSSRRSPRARRWWW